MSAATIGAGEERASVQDWIAVLAGALGALLATLDISIVNSALPQIQGEVGASGTEGTWISTGYLVSEVVMIPLTAWLTRVFGMRRLLISCAVCFSAFSMACGFSHDLISMIVGRVGQGFFGGALLPTAQTLTRTRLPPRQMPLGMSIFGSIVLLGPLLGPILGGTLTENVGWQWCFFINLPISIGLVALLTIGLPSEPMRLEHLVRADWLGIAGMAVCVSCLTVVLEEGQRARWFESEMITGLAIASALGAAAVAVAQLTAERPVLKLRLLLNPRYASVILIVTVTGILLYSILYILPQFLSNISGYNSQQSGLVLALSGIPVFLAMPIIPRLLIFDLRILVFSGLCLMAASCFTDTVLTASSAGQDFVWSQLLRGLGQMLASMPLAQASVGAVGREDTADAAGLYNMARNLGGSFGLALFGVFIDRQVDTHAQTLAASVTANSPLAQSRLAEQAAVFMARTGDMDLARRQALGALSATVQQQALVITYSQAFWLLGMAVVVTLPLVLVLRSPRRLGPTAMAAATAEVH